MDQLAEADGVVIPAAKRQKTTHFPLRGPRDESRDNQPRRSACDYTVAWICALHIELAAGRMMLDEEHKPIPHPSNDSNTYVLGRIWQHNVVIACLPANQYGTNNSASVISNINRTFPSIRSCLLVGIGGGVPSKADVRLGDVVVGTRVMQYDFGKVVSDGSLQKTATPRIPPSSLGTVVSALRSKYELGHGQVASILQERLAIHADYKRPNSPDRLFYATYIHEPTMIDCDGCDHSKLVTRRQRTTCDAVIHYGGIASGNQVMKSATTRDRISRELDVICFEMEAAGIMDVLPCLTIRGICDYSDSHKSKEWQRYAAVAAAAYGREFLEVLPATELNTSRDSVPIIPQSMSQGRRRRLLEALKFDQMDSRRLNIHKNHLETCQWFLDHPSYKSWLDQEQLVNHHGFLWIRGKPGAGKSTMMKFAYLNTKQNSGGVGKTLTASFFFNARGEGLAKSVTGMYRSLLYQLLVGFTDLQAVLEDPELPAPSQHSYPLSVLKELFHNAVSGLGQRSFTCFVDALDESDEQQIIDMVQYFEDLAEHATEQDIQLRVCFSSRHYPYIDVDLGLRLTLEEQPGHMEDVANYVKSRLRVKDSELFEELQPQILEKSAGVFLWVVLVVDILNKEIRGGRPTLKKSFAEIPSDLSELFKSILKRDSENMEDMQLSLLWILLTPRPLEPREYYHALWSGLALKGLVDPEVPDVASLHANERVDRYITSSSKGLAEVTKSTPPIVQFIHESVRDFLIKDNGLQELWPNLGYHWQSLGHERLKQCCSFYLGQDIKFPSKRNRGGKEVVNKFPFLHYATLEIWHHAEAAADTVPQDEFLSCFSVTKWIRLFNFFEPYNVRKYSPNANLFYILAERGLPRLIRTRMKEDSSVHVTGERYKYPIFAALANSNGEAAAALLNAPSRFSDGEDITEGLKHRKDLGDYEQRTPLTWAVLKDRTALVKLLLRAGVAVNEKDEMQETPLQLASISGNEAVLTFLIEAGADVNMQGSKKTTPLLHAISEQNEAAARILIENGAQVNESDDIGTVPLFSAIESGQTAIVRCLIKNGADIHISHVSGKSPLTCAIRHNHIDTAELLINEGESVNSTDGAGRIPLFCALDYAGEAMARFLITSGADVSAKDSQGHTPLSRAIERGYNALAMFLIDRGADVNSHDDVGLTPLKWAAIRGCEGIASRLVKSGADVNHQSGKVTALRTAVERGNEAITRLLLENSADVNHQTIHGTTALYTAVECGNEAITRLLLENGADPSIRGFMNTPPLYLALRFGHLAIANLLIDHGADVNCHDYVGWTPLQWAASRGYKGIASRLVDCGADVNHRTSDGEDTALQTAVERGDEAITRLLLENSADANIRTNEGKTALRTAVERDNEAITRLLLENGADVNHRTRKGKAALQTAVERGNEAITRLLLENGADANIETDTETPPLHLALWLGHLAIANLLIDHGADVNARDSNGNPPLDFALRKRYRSAAERMIGKGAVSGFEARQSADNVPRDGL